VQLRDCHLISVGSGWSLPAFEPFTRFWGSSSRLLSKRVETPANPAPM